MPEYVGNILLPLGPANMLGQNKHVCPKHVWKGRVPRHASLDSLASRMPRRRSGIHWPVTGEGHFKPARVGWAAGATKHPKQA